MAVPDSAEPVPPKHYAEDSAEGEKEDDEDPRHLPEGLWQRLRADPVRAPEYLALAAVAHWGQQARTQAANARRRDPGETSANLAKHVKKRHALLARMEGAAAAVPGCIEPGGGTAAALLPDLAALAWIQSRMVVHIAAVYGYDTNDRETAAELLVLQGIYNSTEAARTAVGQATQRVATRLVMKYVKGSVLQLLKQLFRYVGIKFTRQGLLKAVPFVNIPASAAINELSTRSLANRAIKLYEADPRGTR